MLRRMQSIIRIKTMARMHSSHAFRSSIKVCCSFLPNPIVSQYLSTPPYLSCKCSCIFSIQFSGHPAKSSVRPIDLISFILLSLSGSSSASLKQYSFDTASLGTWSKKRTRQMISPVRSLPWVQWTKMP